MTTIPMQGCVAIPNDQRNSDNLSITSRASSIAKSINTNLDQRSTTSQGGREESPVVSDLNEFHKQQRATKKNAQLRKGEAADNLHHFRHQRPSAHSDKNFKLQQHPSSPTSTESSNPHCSGNKNTHRNTTTGTRNLSVDTDFSSDLMKSEHFISNDKEKEVTDSNNSLDANSEQDFKAFKDRLEKSSNPVVVDLEKFFVGQRNQILEDYQKKKEALEQLQFFEGLHVYSLKKKHLRKTGGTTLLSPSMASLSPSFAALSPSMKAFASSSSSIVSTSTLGKSMQQEISSQFSETYEESVQVDFRNVVNHRTCVFVIHPKNGVLLLHCAKTNNNIPYLQIPSENLREADFYAAARRTNDQKAQLGLAARLRASRKLHEATGIDVRSKLYRLESLELRREHANENDTRQLPKNELGDCLFYSLFVSDDDFIVGQAPNPKMMRPANNVGKDLMLRLSTEYLGFVFEREPTVAAELLKGQLEGIVSEALLLTMEYFNKHASLLNEEPAQSPVASKIVKLKLPHARYRDSREGSPRSMKNSLEMTDQQQSTIYSKDSQSIVDKLCIGDTSGEEFDQNVARDSDFAIEAAKIKQGDTDETTIIPEMDHSLRFRSFKMEQQRDPIVDFSGIKGTLGHNGEVFIIGRSCECKNETIREEQKDRNEEDEHNSFTFRKEEECQTESETKAFNAKVQGDAINGYDGGQRSLNRENMTFKQSCVETDHTQKNSFFYEWNNEEETTNGTNSEKPNHYEVPDMKFDHRLEENQEESKSHQSIRAKVVVGSEQTYQFPQGVIDSTTEARDDNDVRVDHEVTNINESRDNEADREVIENWKGQIAPALTATNNERIAPTLMTANNAPALTAKNHERILPTLMTTNNDWSEPDICLDEEFMAFNGKSNKSTRRILRKEKHRNNKPSSSEAVALTGGDGERLLINEKETKKQVGYNTAMCSCWPWRTKNKLN